MITEKRERHATVRPGHGVRAIVARRRFPDGWVHLWLMVTHFPLLLYFGAKEHAMKSLSPLVTVSLLVGWMLFVCVGSIGVGAAQDCLEPPSGLVSWWPGNGNANDIQGSNNGIQHNGTNFAAGMVGQAFSLDGVDDFVQIPHSPSLDITGNALTLEAWVMPTGGPSTSANIIIQKDVGGALNQRKFSLFTRASNNSLGFLIQTAAGTVTADKGTVPRNQWSHVAGVYDGAQMIWYINGEAVGTEPQTGNIVSTNTPVIIGSFQFVADSFTGFIDDLSIYNRALSEAEIQAIFDAGSAGKCITCNPPPPDMTGWWPGDGNTDDLVGGRDAVLHGNATTGPGFVDQAFVLDGAGDFVEVPHDPALNVGTGDFTVDFWVNFNTTTGEQLLVEKYVENFSATPPGWFLTKLPDNSLRFGTGPGPLVVNSPSLALPPNTWIHIAARRSSGVATILMNGTPVANGPLAYNADSASSLKFGHRGSPSDTPGSTDTRGFFLNGRIDEVELFVGRALSDAEIQDIVMANSTGKCKFPMEELTSLSPATLWLGLKNSDAVGLRLDLQAEVFLNEAKVGEGMLNNVASGSSGFNNAKLHEIPLTLFAPVEVPADAELEITLSVRRTCSGGGHNSGTPRLWYNGQPIDSGSTRDAGTRFGTTIADTTSEFFLHDGFGLSTTAGTAKKFVDVPVDNKTPCPNRPFTPFGTWSRTLP